MRALFAGVVVLSMGTGACGMIAGLSDYEGHLGDPDSSVASVVKDGATLSTSDGDPPLNTDDGTGGDANDPQSDAPWIITDDSTDAALSPDVNTTCDTTTCAGCCTAAGACVGGQSVATCGVGGTECKDCTSMGGACTSGACSTKVADAAAKPVCTASKCPPCIPVYQSSCCKTTDETCGCKTNFGGNGACN
ncbi:MAG TPA: hypothetical protein VK762_20615 [Polyangiaceae bacterium]|jgi:hypothetical protein|nr:hypothetical protein [Polyangiaceae bacterium]